MWPNLVIVATTLLGLVSLVHLSIHDNGLAVLPVTSTDIRQPVNAIMGEGELIRKLSTNQSQFRRSENVAQGMIPNQSVDVLMQLPSIMNAFPAKQYPKQQRPPDRLPPPPVNSVCVCNYETTQILFSVSGANGWRYPSPTPTSWVPLNPQSCRCLPRSAFRQAPEGSTILCNYLVGPGPRRPGIPCLGRNFEYRSQSLYVGAYEYRPVQANAPITFQYAGLARYVADNQAPILTVFIVIFCNEMSTTPVNFHIRPQPRTWSLSSQTPVHVGGSACTSVNGRQFLNLVTEGQALYCSYEVNGQAFDCGPSNSGLHPWIYSQSSNVAAYVRCSGGAVPICSVAPMNEWFRWPVHR